MLRGYAYRCFFARRGKLPIRNRETVRDSERDKAETEKKTGWWLTYPSEKYDNSSVGMIVYSQLIWKVIQNSMVPVITNQKISVSKMVIDAVFWLVFECIFDWI